MNTIQKFGGAIGGMMVSGLALAAEGDAAAADLSTLTSGIDVSNIVTGIMAVAAVMIGVHLTWKGIKFITRAINGS